MVATGTVGQRFTQLIAHLGISKNAFASSLDKTATVIQHIVDERNKPGFDLLCKVFEIYPNVSKDWLLQGAGSMLVSEAAASSESVQAPPVARPRVVEAPPQTPVASSVAAEPAAVSLPVPTVTVPEPASAPVAAQPVAALVAPAPVVTTEMPAAAVSTVAPAVAVPSAPAADTTSWQTALYTQQMAHQLAMAELRNQHLQDQQRMMQQMMDLMKQQMFK